MDYIKSLQSLISKYEDIGLKIEITICHNGILLRGCWVVGEVKYAFNRFYDTDLLTESNLHFNMETLIDAFKNEFKEFLMANPLGPGPLLCKEL